MSSRPSAPAPPTAPGQPEVRRATRVEAEPAARDRAFWMAAAGVRVTRLLGSLQVAIVLLSLFAAVLALGTVVDSQYSPKVAQDFIYRTWWFKLLLLLLGVNIFAAAAKKWPWKRHQTGFLVTHVGLLCLVAGGVVTSFAGIEGYVSLIDTAQPDIQQEYRYRQSAGDMVVADEAAIRVRRMDPAGQGVIESQFVFEPGPLPWQPGGHGNEAAPALLRILDWLEHPAPRAWSANIGDATLKVIGYEPHAREEDFSPSNSGELPALKFQLQSATFGPLPERWLALSTDLNEQSAKLGPGAVELLGFCPAGLEREFLHPPDPAELGKDGVLVISDGSSTRRLPIAESLGKTVDCGGFQVRCTRFVPGESDGAAPSAARIEFDVIRDSSSHSYVAFARLSGLLIRDLKPVRTDPDGISVWYHPPDPRGGRDIKGLIQLVAGDAGKLYYRSFGSAGGQPFGLESSGEIAPGGPVQPVWSVMKGQLRVVDYVPRAKKQPRYVPEDVPPGIENERYVAAVQCRLERPGEPPEEFWVGEGRPGYVVTAGKEHLEIGYTPLTRPLGFDLKLLRAEQTTDPGTRQAASYSSYVQVTDAGDFSANWIPQAIRPATNFLGLTSGGERLDGRDEVIWMNHPLHHRGFKLFQASYQRLADRDDSGKPVSMSRFAVARDPGLPLKYIGSTMLALGIACMYYMKAYFFKSRGARRAAAPAPAG